VPRSISKLTRTTYVKIGAFAGTDERTARAYFERGHDRVRPASAQAIRAALRTLNIQDPHAEVARAQ
jgi:hypothetical protein